MRKILYTLLCLFVVLQLSAEHTNGIVKVHTQPNNNADTQFELFDDVHVDCAVLKNGWFPIAVNIQISKDQYHAPNLVIKKGTTLLDISGQAIGRALTDLYIGDKMMGQNQPQSPKWYASRLLGYLPETAIRTNSIPEINLKGIISNNTSNLSKASFETHFKDFQYLDGLAVPGYAQLESLMIYESAIEDPSPLDRLRLLFDNGQLIAIVHNRPLNLDGYETVKIARQHQLTLIKTMQDAEKKQFIEQNRLAYDLTD